MKKIITIVLLSLLSTASFAAASKNNMQISNLNSKMEIRETWRLEYHLSPGYRYHISNPSHIRAVFAIKLHDRTWEGIETDPINLYCNGEKIIVKQKNQLTTCMTTDDISFDVIPSQEQYTGISEGEFILEMK